MARKAGDRAGAPVMPSMARCARCKVVSLVTVDGRGQMVLPKELREQIGIRPGEKLALVHGAGWTGVLYFTGKGGRVDPMGVGAARAAHGWSHSWREVRRDMCEHRHDLSVFKTRVLRSGARRRGRSPGWWRLYVTS